MLQDSSHVVSFWYLIAINLAAAMSCRLMSAGSTSLRYGKQDRRLQAPHLWRCGHCRRAILLISCHDYDLAAGSRDGAEISHASV